MIPILFPPNLKGRNCKTLIPVPIPIAPSFPPSKYHTTFALRGLWLVSAVWEWRERVRLLGVSIRNRVRVLIDGFTIGLEFYNLLYDLHTAGDCEIMDMDIGSKSVRSERV